MKLNGKAAKDLTIDERKRLLYLMDEAKSLIDEYCADTDRNRDMYFIGEHFFAGYVAGRLAAEKAK